uniref:Uncharacterized protein n=1 Tax=Sphaerodactylus townsendi TaxID=933632 RepID=A0ACB8FMI7_9SAUR
MTNVEKNQKSYNKPINVSREDSTSPHGVVVGCHFKQDSNLEVPLQSARLKHFEETNKNRLAKFLRAGQKKACLSIKELVYSYNNLGRMI